MRVAVLSDVHGFSLALRTVLADIDAQGPFDQIVVAGDLCETGPDPRGVLEQIQQRNLTAIHGNTDRYLVDEAQQGTDKPGRQFTISQIGDVGIEYLEFLPFSHRISPPGGRGPEDDLLVVHANPHDVETALQPDMSDDELRAIIGDVPVAALAFGHIHISYIRQLGSTLLVDVAAVGNPKDGDLRCKYGILTWDGQRWDAEIRRLEYPLAETEAQIRASGLPNAEKVVRQLREASY